MPDKAKSATHRWQPTSGNQHQCYHSTWQNGSLIPIYPHFLPILVSHEELIWNPGRCFTKAQVNPSQLCCVWSIPLCLMSLTKIRLLRSPVPPMWHSNDFAPKLTRRALACRSQNVLRIRRKYRMYDTQTEKRYPSRQYFWQANKIFLYLHKKTLCGSFRLSSIQGLVNKGHWWYSPLVLNWVVSYPSTLLPCPVIMMLTTSLSGTATSSVLLRITKTRTYLHSISSKSQTAVPRLRINYCNLIQMMSRHMILKPCDV